MPKISKDRPLAEITLRKYEKPSQMERRELVRKICLSLGLLQPGDSRDVVVDVMQAFLDVKTPQSAEEIVVWVASNRESKGLAMQGIAGSNIRRQIKRIKDLMIIEKTGTKYSLAEGMDLRTIFMERIERYHLAPIKERIIEYLDLLPID